MRLLFKYLTLTFFWICLFWAPLLCYASPESLNSSLNVVLFYTVLLTLLVVFFILLGTLWFKQKFSKQTSNATTSSRFEFFWAFVPLIIFILMLLPAVLKFWLN